MKTNRLTGRKPDGLVIFKSNEEKYISNMNYGEVGRCMEKLALLEEMIEEGVLIDSATKCSDCKYEECLSSHYPCSHCCNNFQNLFEHKDK